MPLRSSSVFVVAAAALAVSATPPPDTPVPATPVPATPVPDTPIPNPPPAICHQPTLKNASVLALNAFYQAAGGDGWSHNSHWGRGDPCQDSWYGITCACPGGTQMHVESIVLPSNGLVGTVPQQTFASFPMLAKVDLSENRLTGPVPSFDPMLLPALRFLYLQQADKPTGTFTGDTAQLWTLPALEVLDLYNNKGLVGQISHDFGYIVRGLSVLNLRGTGISGALPASFWDITTLTNVDITGLGLTGSIGFGVGEMAGFRILQANGNKLSGRVPAFHSMAFTQPNSMIFLTGSQLTNVPDQFFNKGVTGLQMSNNLLQGELTAAIGNAVAMEYLYLDNNQLGGALPKELCNMKALVTLKLSYNGFTSVPSCLGQGFSAIEDVLLFNNNLQGTLPVKTMCEMATLQQLQVQNNGGLGGSLEPCISNWTSMTALIVDRTRLSGTIPEALFTLSHLKTLILSQSLFEGSIPDLFHRTPGLTSVVIQSGHVGNYVITPHISGGIPASLFNLPKLASLSLQFNRLSGTIPDLFGGKSGLAQVMLNNNLLAGTIPPSLVSMLESPGVADRRVMIDHNLLTGTIPDLSKIQNTAEVVINNNQLLGYPPISYSKTYPWLNKKTPDAANRYNTFFQGMRLLPPVPRYVEFMSGGTGYFFETTGKVVVDAGPSNLLSNADPSQVVKVEAAFLCDAADQWGSGAPGVFASVNPPAKEDEAAAAEGSSDDDVGVGGEVPADFKLFPVRHPIPQDAAQPFQTGFLEFNIPGAILANLTHGPATFSLWFKGNTNANASDVAQKITRRALISQGTLPSAIVYDPTPPVYSITPLSGRRWGCVDVTVLGASFTDTGGGNIQCKFAPSVGAALTTSGTFVNETAVACHVASNATAGFPLASFAVAVSLDGGKHWSVSEAAKPADVVFTFEDDCPVSPMIPSLRNDCPCGLCECGSAGACFRNDTTHAMQCRCQEGFTGATCEECLPEYYGVDCKRCPTCSGHGTCSATKTGSGSCSCVLWYGLGNCQWYYKYWLIIGAPVLVVVTVASVFLYRVRRWKKRLAEDAERQHLNTDQ
eukprot:Rhum_TRINITY_DN10102_c0_g1::Rhum_TRINITY_DN10102_c0_g1_i1::g.36928::m.36928